MPSSHPFRVNNQKGVAPLFIMLAVLVVVLIGVGAYYLGTSNTPVTSETSIPEMSPNPTLSPSSTATSSANLNVSPSPSPSGIPINPVLLKNITDSVISKNTAPLEGYMMDTVKVTIEATECCGNLGKIEAIEEMEFLNSATQPWNFADTNPFAMQLRQKNPQTFPSWAIIGTSANRMVVVFTLNVAKTKIETLYMAPDYKLLGI